jgi:hypothetical protein
VDSIITTTLSAFSARLRERIRTGMREGDFESLALELFALQFENNHAYRTFCERMNRTPENTHDWREIPAVPAAAFKELQMTSLKREEQTAVFYSSGTTAERRSRHFHSAESLSLYEDSLLAWFKPNVTAKPTSIICLIPPPLEAPNSSLAHMFQTVRNRLGAEDSIFLGVVSPDGGWSLDLDRSVAAMEKMSTGNQPALIMGTAFAFVHLLDHVARQNCHFTLTKGSLALETGGYKGRSRSLPKAQLHSLISDYLGIEAPQIVCEYGMSELGSQAYSSVAVGSRRREEADRVSESIVPSAASHRPLPEPFQFPPWARARIISPETGAELEEGGTGLIEVFDLANVYSVMAIKTEDLGINRGGGFELVGRADIAEPRGCSLMAPF